MPALGRAPVVQAEATPVVSGIFPFHMPSHSSKDLLCRRMFPKTIHVECCTSHRWPHGSRSCWTLAGLMRSAPWLDATHDCAMRAADADDVLRCRAQSVESTFLNWKSCVPAEVALPCGAQHRNRQDVR